MGGRRPQDAGVCRQGEIMRLNLRPTGSLLLSAVALVLAAVFSVWCVSIALSASRLRQDLSGNMEVLRGLDALRGTLLELEMTAEKSPAGTALDRAAWTHRFSAATETLKEIAGDPAADWLTERLAKIEQAMGAMHDAAVVLSGPAAPPNAEALFDDQLQIAHARITNATAMARGRSAAISESLASKWRSLSILSGLSIATVVALVGLFQLAGRDARRHAEADRALRLSEARFRSVLSAAPDVILILDAAGGYRSVFTSATGLLIRQPEELQGKTIHDLFEPQVAREFQAVIDTVIASRSLQTFEYPLKTGGEDRWFSARVVPFGDPGDPCVLWIARDLTARKLAEERLRESEARFRESEARFRSIFEQAAAGIVTASLDGHFLQVNGAMCRLLGYTEEELKRLTIADVTHPDDRAETARHMAEAKAGRRKVVDLEKRYVRKDGAVAWGHVTVDWLLGADGRPAYSVAMIQDITARKRADDALKERQEQLRSIVDTASDAVIAADGSGTITLWNKASERIFGYTAGAAIGRPISMIIPDPFREAAAVGLEPAAARGGDGSAGGLLGRTVELTGLRQGGGEFPIELSLASWRTDKGVFFTGIIRDITDRRRVEQALRESNEELELRVGQRTADLETANLLLKQENSERRRAESIHAGRSKVLQLLAAGAALPDVLNALLQGMEDVDPDMLCSLLLLDRESKRLRHGAALRLPEFYNRAIDGLQIGPGIGCCGTAASTGEVVIAEDVMTHPYWESFRDLARRAGIGACWSVPIMSSTNEVLGTFAIYHREPRAPSEPYLEYVKSAAHLAGIAIEAKRAEADLAESQARLRVADRLASLGTLTAGLGHDMNNVLFPIRCRLDALDWKTLTPDVRELLAATRQTIDYLQELARGLHLLAIDAEESRGFDGATSIAAWWNQVKPLMTKMVPPAVTLETDLAADLPSVRIAPHQLTQAVLNLITNASEAMPGGGRVQIRARRNGRWPQVCISVSDEGVGMTEEVAQRAFDPFFTTKTRSLSTGLGLTLVHNVARLCGGSINVESTPGRGSIIELVLPAANGTQGPNRPAGEPGRAVVSLRDRRTAAWVTRVLRTAGYDVGPNGDPAASSLWVTEPIAENLEAARRLAAAGDRRVIVLGSAGPDWALPGAVRVEDVENLEAIRSAVRAVQVKP